VTCDDVLFFGLETMAVNHARILVAPRLGKFAQRL